MSMSINDRIKQVLIVLAILVVIVILVALIDIKTVIATIRKADNQQLIWAVFFMALGFVIVSIRLHFILGKKGPLRRVFFGDALSYMSAPFLPIPTPVLRAIAVERTTSFSAARSSPAVTVDYLMGGVMRGTALILILLMVPSKLDTAWSVAGSILVIILILSGVIWVVNRLDRTFNALARWSGMLPRVEEENVREMLAEVEESFETAGSGRNMVILLVYTLIITLCFVLYQYFVWRALPVDFHWRQMLALSLAALVVVPPTAPLMIGAYQGVLAGALVVLQIADVNQSTAYAVLAQALQIIFWLIAGLWVLFRTDIKVRDLVRGSEDEQA